MSARVISRVQSTSPVAFYLYDAVYLYMLALNKTVADGDNHRNGSLLVRNSIGQNFVGKLLSLIVDKKDFMLSRQFQREFFGFRLPFAFLHFSFFN